MKFCSECAEEPRQGESGAAKPTEALGFSGLSGKIGCKASARALEYVEDPEVDCRGNVARGGSRE